ncbi:MAG: hypothetical protein BroJett018_53070 [Chloroflexota bacterium]|nr:MAG: hypothetical protein BroJett018_53070 [Chloroflexota bacterium]
MQTPAMVTVLRMMESLPEAAQERIADQLREYIAELMDEVQWDDAFAATQPQLEAAARRAKQQIRAGQAKPFDPDAL